MLAAEMSFLLATAYHLSGFDEILREDLANDKYVYGGFSAGAMAICETIRHYGHDHFITGVRTGGLWN